MVKLFVFVVSAVLTQVYPGSRQGHVMRQADADTIYIFGGNGYGNSAILGDLSDVWKFDISTSNFSHVKGPQTVNRFATFGTAPNAANQPGARSFAASTFLGSKIYVFGGWGYVDLGTSGYLADLWSFDPTDSMWLFLGGSQSLNDIGVYGAANSYNSSFRPGGRQGARMSCNTNGTELILYGGLGRAVNTITRGTLGDVWYFRLSDNKWAYRAGHTTADQLGTTSYPQRPGTRHGTIFECAPRTEMCYIFGGDGNVTADGYLADFWAFNQTSGLFSPLSRGEYSTVNVLATYSTKGKYDTENTPGNRAFAASYFDAANNRLIVYGGYGYHSIGIEAYLNDVWSFDVSSGSWAWISGESVANQEALDNRGGARYSHGIAFVSPTSFYIFGGEGYGSSRQTGLLNDLWLHTIPDAWIRLGGSLNLNSRGDYFDESANRRPSNSSSTPFSTSTTLGNIETTSSQLTRALRIAARAGSSTPLSAAIIGVIIGVSISLVGCLIFVIACVRYTRLKQFASEKPLTYTETTSKMTTSNVTTANLTTIAPTSLGLSLPGHLAVNEIDFRCGELLASGGGGDVYSGDAIGFHLMSRCSSIVIKRPKVTSYTTIKLFEQEISVMYLLSSSQFVATMVGFMLKPPVLLMKMYSEGSLLSLVSKQALIRKWKLRFSLDIARGLLDIHTAQIAHCDIKPQNVLIDRDSQGMPFCVITDFGIAQVLSEKLVVVKYTQAVSVKGLSVHYAAPEVFKRFRNLIELKTPADMKLGDIYAFAMSMYFLLCRRESWKLE